MTTKLTRREFSKLMAMFGAITATCWDSAIAQPVPQSVAPKPGPSRGLRPEITRGALLWLDGKPVPGLSSVTISREGQLADELRLCAYGLTQEFISFEVVDNYELYADAREMLSGGRVLVAFCEGPQSRRVYQGEIMITNLTLGTESALVRIVVDGVFVSGLTPTTLRAYLKKAA